MALGDGFSMIIQKNDLSVIMPCYQNARLAVTSTAELCAFLSVHFRTWEVIIVDDGGQDFDSLGWVPPAGVRLIRLPINKGKGAAVRTGMLAANGDVRLFTDVDLPYDLELIPAMVHYIRKAGFHIVIGDRQLPDSKYHQQIQWQRRLSSKIFSFIAGAFITGGFFDTQCGLKCFRGDIAMQLFSNARVNRFAFDVELVYIALINQLDIKRIPVCLRENSSTSVRLIYDSFRMLIDISLLKLNREKGIYKCPELQRLVTEDFARVQQLALPRDENGS